MNKNSVLLSILLALTVIFSGCEDDDDSVSLEGTWNASNITLKGLDGAEHDRQLPSGWSEQITLNADGTFIFSATQEGTTTTGSGSWERIDNQIVLDYKGQGQISYSFNGSNLVLEGDIPEGTFKLFWIKEN